MDPLRSLRRGAMALTQSSLRAGFSSWFEFALLAEEKSRSWLASWLASAPRCPICAEHVVCLCGGARGGSTQLQSAASAFRGDGVHKAQHVARARRGRARMRVRCMCSTSAT